MAQVINSMGMDHTHKHKHAHRLNSWTKAISINKVHYMHLV